MISNLVIDVAYNLWLSCIRRVADVVSDQVVIIRRVADVVLVSDQVVIHSVGLGLCVWVPL